MRDGSTEYGGYYSWLSSGASSGTNNPVAQLMQTDNTALSNRIIGNVQAEYKFHFMPELKLNVNIGLDRSTSDGHNRAGKDAQFTKVTTVDGTTLQGRNNTYSGRNHLN